MDTRIPGSIFDGTEKSAAFTAFVSTAPIPVRHFLPFPAMTQTIAVLDFGSQYTQVIARRIRECQVYSKIYHYTTPAETLKKDGVLGIILSGGPSSVLAKNAPLPDRAIFTLGLPVLGICYGVQLMGQFLGGKVAHSDEREYGHGRLQILRQGSLFAGLGHVVRVWNSHGDKLTQLPPRFLRYGPH